jgi:toxin secretion/phage lysis holin
MDFASAAITAILSAIGGGLISYLGGWDSELEFLLVFIVLDILTGTLSSLLFGKSKHTKSGRFASRAFYRGLATKVCILCIVVVSVGLDRILGIDYVRDTVVLFFIFNEAMSILENAECMGLPIPLKLRKMLDVFWEEMVGDDEKEEPQQPKKKQP